MQQNKRVVTLGGIAIILAVVAVVVYARRARDLPQPTSDVTLEGICLSCQQAVVAHYHIGARPEDGPPAVCPKCSKRTVYSTYYCESCKLRVVPKLEAGAPGKPPKIPVIPTCPKCGKANLVGYLSADPEHAQASVGALPAWP